MSSHEKPSMLEGTSRRKNVDVIPMWTSKQGISNDCFEECWCIILK